MKTELTNEQKQELRVKVAELCGWKKRGDVWIRRDGFEYYSGDRDLPDYPNDLNACREMRKSVKDESRWRQALFWVIRDDIGLEKWDYMEPDERAIAVADATANQLCRAFVMTMEGKR